MAHCFSATIFKVGINPCVDVPERVSLALARRGYIPVQGKLNGHPFQAGLVSLGKGRHRLFINGEMRRAARVDVGDRITVVLEYDPKPRETPIQERCAQALNRNPAAKSSWNNLVPSRRKDILSYFNSLKRVESLDRNIARTIRILISARDKR